MIPTQCQCSRDPNIESSFASNQTFNIFYPKILHASFSTSDLPCTDLDITSHISALALSGVEVLRVLRSQADLQEKTTYRSAPFGSGGGARGFLMLYEKPLEEPRVKW